MLDLPDTSHVNLDQTFSLISKIHYVKVVMIRKAESAE